jgi:hypothetical protein
MAIRPLGCAATCGQPARSWKWIHRQHIYEVVELLARRELERFATVFHHQEIIATFSLRLWRAGLVSSRAAPIPGWRLLVHPERQWRITPIATKFGSYFHKWHDERHLTVELSGAHASASFGTLSLPRPLERRVRCHNRIPDQMTNSVEPATRGVITLGQNQPPLACASERS